MSKKLTNEGKLKHTKEFQEKFPDALTIFHNFLKLKSNLRPRSGHIQVKAQKSVSLSFLIREWAYSDKKVAEFGMMDLRMAPTNADHDANSHSLHISRECKECQSHPLAIPWVWLWVHNSEEQAKQSADFVKQFLPEYKSVHSIYRASKNKHLDDAKTRASPASVFLLFLFKRENDCASRL